MELDRRIRQIAASDQEHGGIQEAEPPGRGGEVADFNFFGH